MIVETDHDTRTVSAGDEVRLVNPQISGFCSAASLRVRQILEPPAAAFPRGSGPARFGDQERGPEGAASRASFKVRSMVGRSPIRQAFL